MLTFNLHRLHSSSHLSSLLTQGKKTEQYKARNITATCPGPHGVANQGNG